MILGIPAEVKNGENRVAIVPGGVQILKQAGHRILIQKGAGIGAGIPDDKYEAAGAEIVPTAKDVWGTAEMIVKVKEPIASEFELMREGQILYTYLHLAAATELGKKLVEKKVTAQYYLWEPIFLPVVPRINSQVFSCLQTDLS